MIDGLVIRSVLGPARTAVTLALLLSFVLCGLPIAEGVELSSKPTPAYQPNASCVAAAASSDGPCFKQHVPLDSTAIFVTTLIVDEDQEVVSSFVADYSRSSLVVIRSADCIAFNPVLPPQDIVVTLQRLVI